MIISSTLPLLNEIQVADEALSDASGLRFEVITSRLWESMRSADADIARVDSLDAVTAAGL
jgi:hypothetical protein